MNNCDAIETAAMKRWPSVFLAASVGLVLAVGCSGEYTPLRLQGETMGTTWSVVTTRTDSDRELVNAITTELVRINDVMSTWQSDSELSLVNAIDDASPVQISPELYSLINMAQEIHEQSDGAYDVTVGALVGLWGFGPTQRPVRVPDDDAINRISADVGFGQLHLLSDGLKKPQGLAIDLSSIAKGYAVDQLSELLTTHGREHFMVEIGGEIRAHGLSPRGTLWRIGIERPESGHRIPFTSLSISGMAVATSGDYRNYFEDGGKRYSHIIDPRTGYPVEHRLVSATVLHPSAAMADGYATAITVMGDESGLAMAERQRLPVLLIIRQNDSFEAVSSTAFQHFVRTTDG